MVKTKLLKQLVDPKIGVSLAAAVEDGNGVPVDVTGKDNFTAVITAADVTTGATITFEASLDGVVYAPVGFEGIAGTRVASTVVGADGSTTWKIDGVNAAKFMRAVVGSRTDGTFTVTIAGM